MEQHNLDMLRKLKDKVKFAESWIKFSENIEEANRDGIGDDHYEIILKTLQEVCIDQAKQVTGEKIKQDKETGLTPHEIKTLKQMAKGVVSYGLGVATNQNPTPQNSEPLDPQAPRDPVIYPKRKLLNEKANKSKTHPIEEGPQVGISYKTAGHDSLKLDNANDFPDPPSTFSSVTVKSIDYENKTVQVEFTEQDFKGLTGTISFYDINGFEHLG